jgi:hypothetical protein
MELSKHQMKEALMTQREILGLGDCSESAHINYYFTSPFQLDDGVVTGKELNKFFK